MYKLVAFDIDGTTLPYGVKKFQKKMINVFKQLKDKGIYVVLITGRELITMNKLYDTPHVDYYAGGNGSIALDFKTKKILWEDSFKRDDVLKMYRQFGDNSDMLLVDSKNPYFSKTPHIDWFWNDHRELWKPLNEDTLTNEIEIDNIHVLVFKTTDDEKHTKAKIIQKFITENNIEMEVGAIWSKGFFVQKKGVNKGYALKKLAEMLKIDIKDTVSFGDGENDYELLETAGYGVMINNGSTHLLKKVAQGSCNPPENLGVLDKLKELNIL